MRCPSCGTENPPGSQYCTGCAVPLDARAEDGQPVVYCTQCGTENAAGATFCTSCGTVLSSSQGAGAPRAHDPYLQVPLGATDNLVPRELGELLRETFRVYGRNFWAFLAIALIPQIPSLIGQLLPVLSLLVVFTVVAVVLYILAEGAAVSAVVRQYLGRDIRVVACYTTAQRRFVPLLAGFVLFLVPPFLWVLLTVFLPFLVIGLPLILYLVVRWSFYPEAIMIERTGPIGALGRSGELVRGSWWRVFGIGLIFVVPIVILGIVIPGIVSSSINPIAGAILFVISGTVLAPIAYIGATLVYFDLRVRREGYSLGEMASEVGR